MAYEKNTWATGDVITATLLNHMETGIEEAGGGSGEFTTYHAVVNAAIDDSTGFIESGTIQTDLPGVTDWATFESVCRNLADGPNQLHFRVNISREGSGYVDYPTYQFMGLINKTETGAVTVTVCGDNCEFKMGNDDGIYRVIVLRCDSAQYNIDMDGFTFVS